MGIAGGLLFWVDPARSPDFPACLFHKYTGLLCPGCGSLRAMHQLLHGRLEAALHLNALLVLSLPFLGVWAFLTLRRQWLHQPAPGITKPWFFWAVGVVLLFGILRNLPFAQHLWLAP
jgi:Protein of unknown function (DUF2752)